MTSFLTCMVEFTTTRQFLIPATSMQLQCFTLNFTPKLQVCQSLCHFFLGAVELLALVFEAELTEVVEVLCWFLYHCNISLENVSPKSPLLILFVAFFGGGGGGGGAEPPLAGLFLAGNSGGLVLLLSLEIVDVDEDSDPFLLAFLYLVLYL